MDHAAWIPAPDHPPLPGNEIHVWRVDLNAGADEETFPAIARCLSPEEQERARRFQRPEPRRSFVAARVALRVRLGRYLAVAPKTLVFRYNPHGKPALHSDAEAETLVFNVSHAAGLALIAVGRSRRLGVDIESGTRRTATAEIAERFFAPGEVRRLRSLPPGRQRDAFFQCWTRKEAFIKACGEGLARPLAGFEVTFGEGVAPALLRADGETEAARRWRIWDLHPAPGFAGALAADGGPAVVRTWIHDPVGGGTG